MALHPFIQAVLAKQREMGRPAISSCSPAEARALIASGRAGLGPGPEMARVEQIEIPTRGGRIPARLFVPEGEIRALIAYAHGGGWVIGELDDFDSFARTLAARAQAAVLLIDYRLAPEHPFPAGLEDCEDALARLRSTKELLGREVPVVIAGDSAGANLMTVAAHRLRGRFSPLLQVLLYPVTDCDLGRASYRSESDGMPITRADMVWFFDHYVPDGQRADPAISPLREPDLSGMPRTLIMVAEHDVLRDEGEAYAARLREAGTEVELKRYDGAPHGFIRMHNLYDTADRAVSDVAAAIAGALASARAGA
ncbi:alpha/beta hydrolase [Bosea sp. (in: a-proteobacteria)]|jgi:acetyl esterase|uniref:alpha/beta hydrolase n=1 Tax=Bosea sp. (in: a-proteobacteria) TaxID=1871050 RepID=UPI002DDDA44C|nr:alpha/beta hydrolase [Bosea sp. (in: a-proteobacteria)]HEV2512123.1 alpha/beta hydrolase [Bosea sp. (in: a-proteobacteria)]